MSLLELRALLAVDPRTAYEAAMTYQSHPAAMLFPMMTEAQLDELAADIAEHGQHEPIICTGAGLILDGRNRLEACHRAKVDPEIQCWDREDDGISPTAWVISRNLRRRHLTPSQAALVAAEALPLFEAEAKERQKAHGGTAPGRKSLSAPGREVSGKAASAAATSASIGARTVERAKAVLATAPAAVIEQIRAGEKTLKQVERETNRAEQIAQVKAYTPPAGEYSVIVADPPWRYDDALDGSDVMRGGCPYPTMTLEEICALKVPAAADCILWLWTTNAFLADGSAGAVLRAWGFESKTILTWVKPRMGVGRWLRNSTEHCILATRGKPAVALRNQTTELRAPPGDHSAKPEAFFGLVEQLCPSPSRLELFSRAERKGWVTSGAEVGAAVAAPAAVEPEPPDAEDALADYEALAKIVEADDKLSAARGEIRAALAKQKQLLGMYEAKSAEVAGAQREARRWMRKAQKSAACKACKAALGAP